MIDVEGYWFKVFQNTTMSKRELERHLRGVGLSRKFAKVVASKCGRPVAVESTYKGLSVSEMFDRITL